MERLACPDISYPPRLVTCSRVSIFPLALRSTRRFCFDWLTRAGCGHPEGQTGCNTFRCPLARSSARW
jgi:hypothetical protein